MTIVYVAFFPTIGMDDHESCKVFSTREKACAWVEKQIAIDKYLSCLQFRCREVKKEIRYESLCSDGLSSHSEYFRIERRVVDV